MRYRIEEIKLNLDEALIVNKSLRVKKDGNRIAVFCDEEILKKKIEGKLRRKKSRCKSPVKTSSGVDKVRAKDVSNVEIIRRAIDARENVKFVFTLDFDCDKSLPLATVNEIVANKKDYSRNIEEASREARPIVVGFGPCGMFCALILARAGLKPIVIERGSSIDERISKVNKFWQDGKLNPECNVQFGEGGAGTFSDGKLNTGIKDERIRFVLQTFVEAGAPSDILIDARPHIGTDVLRSIVKNIRNEIISLGGDVRFDTRMENVELSLDEPYAVNTGEESSVKGITVALSQGLGDGDDILDLKREHIDTDTVALALGHSARDTVRGLYVTGLVMEPKQFSMGVRVQHAQELIDRASYGQDYGHVALPPAYYKLSYRAKDGRGVYSFCMCPGGEIVNASSIENAVVTNGMSNAARDSGYANSGILVDVKPADYLDEIPGEEKPLSGMTFQEKYERLAFYNGGGDYTLPECTWQEYSDVMKSKNEIDNARRENAEKVIASLPDFVARDIFEAMPHFGKKLEEFDCDDALMVAVESRSSSPVRIVRDKNTLQARLRINDSGGRDCVDCSADVEDATIKSIAVKGLYPGGEGAGYAGGITSAACDGIKIAEKIIESRR